MEALAQQLQRLAEGRNWPALAAVDRKVSALLAALPPRAQWSARESDAFEHLRRAHRAVQELCDSEAARLGAQLQDLRNHRQGWVAYALMELEEAI